MVLLFPLLHLLPVLLGSAEAGSLRYDQTQTGDTNIHLQIKNVEVLALLDDISPGEYDYDYSDFTEKPHKPHNGTTSSSHGVSSSTFPPVEASNITDATSVVANSTVEGTNMSEVPSEEPLLGPTTAPAAPAAPEVQTVKKSRRCGSGFYRDTLGRCRRIRRPHLQMLVNLGRKKPIDSATDA